MIKNQDMEFLHGQVATFTRETIKMTPGMALGKCTGQMEVTTKASGKTVSNMAKVIVSIIDLGAIYIPG